jgi:hypothetical protein
MRVSHCQNLIFASREQIHRLIHKSLLLILMNREQIAFRLGSLERGWQAKGVFVT